MRRLDAGTERRLADGFARTLRAPASREVLGHGFFAVTFLLAAGALALFAHAERPLSVPVAAAFVLALALTSRVEFSVGAGYAVPTQLVVVPMMLLLPTPLVPLLVGLAYVGTDLEAGLRGRRSLARLLQALADAWSAIPPALVLIVLHAQGAAWSHWPAYLAALAVQPVSDGIITLSHMRLAVGLRPRDLLSELRQVWRVDVLLWPIGLLAALAAAPVPLAALLVLPLVLLVSVLAREREERIEHSLELSRAYRGTALLLRDVLEEDDEYTGRHTEDVVGLSIAVAEELGVDEDVRRATELGALLHDVGKIAIPDEIINKPGPLDDAEWAIMKTHTVEGQRMLDRVGGLLADVGVVVRASHERWDGGGYPDGLVGQQIPLAARIVSACDAFNAMTTDRSYRRALPLGVAVGELRANAGTQFDPAVVEALCAVVGAGPAAEPLEWQASVTPDAAPAVSPPPAGAPAPAR